MHVLMLRKIAFCTACLAARGLAPGSSFALPTQVVARRGHSSSKIGFIGGVQQIPSGSRQQQQQQQRQRQRQTSSAIPTGRPLCCRRGDEEIESAIPEDPSSARDDAGVPSAAARAATENRAQDPVNEALAASKTLVTGAVMACSLFASSTLNLETTAPAHAVAQQQQQSPAVVAPQPPRRVRPPPPEVPPGRITIVQWCDRNIGRYLPKVDVQAAAETAENIRVNSGPAPTVENLRRMAGDVAKRERGGLLGEALARRGKKLVSPSEGIASSEAKVRSPESIRQEEIDAPKAKARSPESIRQEEIDALKAEMLERQRAPPETSQGSSERQDAYNSAPPLPRVSSILPPPLDTGVTTPTGADAMAQRAARDRPAASRKEKKRPPRTVQSVAIDLKAELRTQSEKVTASSSSSSSSSPSSSLSLSPSRQPFKRNAAPPRTSAAQVTPSDAVPREISPAAPAYSAPEVAQSLASATKASVVKASAESGGDSAGASGVRAGLEAVVAGERTAQQELDLRRVSDKMQGVAGQVQDAAGSGGHGSRAGATAATEQGRASSSVGNAAASLTDKLLPTGVPDPAEVGRAASKGLSEGSGRIAARLSSSARKAATQMGEVKERAAGIVGSGATAAGRGWGRVGRGVGGAFSSVEDAGRVVSDGATKLSRGAADGLPVLQGQASALSSQVADASSRAASSATDVISAASGDISRRLSDLAGGRSDLNLAAQGVLGQLSTLGRALADAAMVALRTAAASIRGILRISSDNKRGDGMVYAVVAVLTGGAAAVVQRIGGGGGVGAGVGAAGGEKAGEDRAKGEVERPLQPIGGATETVAAIEGERYGAEAMSASGTLWDMIRDSGTGAGDAVREVSEEDLLARAAGVGGQLRETAEELEVLKAEVLALRESIRESDLEGKARVLREALASTLEGPVAE